MEKRKFKVKDVGNFILYYVIPMLTLFPVLYISQYARPVVDDFDYGLYTHVAVTQGGSLTEIIEAALNTCRIFYLNFQGTYSSCFLMSLHPGVFNEKMYGITTWLLVGMIFLGFFVFFSSIQKNILKEQENKKFYWTILSLIVVVLGMPSPSEGLYWYVGSVHYIPWMMLMICNMALVLDLYFTNSRIRAIVLLSFSSLISYLISGGNQLTGFANILLLAMVTIFFVYKKRKYYLSCSLLAAILGFSVMAMAPGNAVRQSAFVRPGIIKTMIMSLLYVLRWTMEWINGVSIVAILLFVPFIYAVAKKIKESIFCQYPLIVFMATAMVFCGMACVPFYAMGGFGDGRTINVLWMYFFVACMFNIICVVGWYLRKREEGGQDISVIHSNQYIRNICFVVGIVIIALFSSGANGEYSTSMKAIRELRNKELQTYAMELDQRSDLYNNKDIKNVEVEPLSEQPSLLYINDIGENPEQWPNGSIALYYGKDSVRVKVKGE